MTKDLFAARPLTDIRFTIGTIGRSGKIWFETCRECNASLFDAGKFKDFAEHTISDFFEALNAPERR